MASNKAAQKKNNSNEGKKESDFLFYTLLIISTLIAYYSTFSFDFTNWDEKRYIFETPIVQKLNWKNVQFMFTKKVLNSYNPFVLLSLAFDYSIAEAKPFLYHAHNVILHLINTILVFMLFRTMKFSGFVSFVIAALFSLHPMHVEAVSWVASRKDVLYGMYYLLSLLFFVKHYFTKKTLWIVLSVIAFLFSLLSKSQAVTLPLALILIEFYLSGKFEVKSMLNKIPFFILSVIFGIVTISGSAAGLTADEFGANFGFVDKLFLSTHALGIYIYKCFLPVNQSATYAFTENNSESISMISYASILIVPVILFVVWKLYKTRQVYFIGSLFFLVHISLVLHVIATNSSLIYERFTYISYIGLFMVIAVWLEDYIIKIKGASQYAVIAIICIAGIITTRSRAEIWRNSETLWTDVIEKQPTISTAYNNRGNVYYNAARWDLALADFNKSIALNPKYPNSYSNRGSVNIYLGKFQESLADNEKAISINPNFAEAWLGKGVALYNLNRQTEAIECYNKAISLLPNFPNAYNNRGGAYFKMKEYTKAIADFEKAISLAKNYDEAKVNLGLTYMEMQEFAKAEQILSQATTDPRAITSLSENYFKMGRKAYDSGDKAGAIALYNKAVSTNPNNADAWYNLGGTYLMSNDIANAKQCWQKVLQINPNHSEAAKWLKQIGG